MSSHGATKLVPRLCSNRKSRRELLSTAEASWATTKSVGMWKKIGDEPCRPPIVMAARPQAPYGASRPSVPGETLGSYRISFGMNMHAQPGLFPGDITGPQDMEAKVHPWLSPQIGQDAYYIARAIPCMIPTNKDTLERRKRAPGRGRGLTAPGVRLLHAVTCGGARWPPGTSCAGPLSSSRSASARRGGRPRVRTEIPYRYRALPRHRSGRCVA